MGVCIACLSLIWLSIVCVLTLLPVSMIVQGCTFCTRGPFETIEMQSTGMTDFGVFNDHDDITEISLYGMMQFRRSDLPIECWAASTWVIQGYKWDDAEKVAKIQFPKGSKRLFYVVLRKGLCLDARYSESAENDVEVSRLNGICILCVTQPFLWVVLFFLCKKNGCFQARSWRFRWLRKLCSRFSRWLARPYYRFSYYRWLQRLPASRPKSICLEPLSFSLSEIYVTEFKVETRVPGKEQEDTQDFLVV